MFTILIRWKTLEFMWTNAFEFLVDDSTRESDPQVSIVESESINSSLIPNPTCNSVHLWTIESSLFYFHVSKRVFRFYQGARTCCCLDRYPLEGGSYPRQWQMSSYLHINCFKAGSVWRSGMLLCRQTSSGYLSNVFVSTIFSFSILLFNARWTHLST